METEQRLNVVIGDVNKIIMKPLEELYSATTSVIVEDAPCMGRLLFRNLIVRPQNLTFKIAILKVVCSTSVNSFYCC